MSAEEKLPGDGEDVHRDLVMRIAAGDRSAEAEFARRYERGVRVLVRRHCRPADPIVDDLVQDVLSNVIERMRAGAIRNASALPAYVQATVVYATSAEYRRRRPTETMSVIEDMPVSEGPSEQLSNSQLGAMLRTLLAEMTVARDRELLIRFYLDDLPKDEVAAELGIDPKHFHRVVFRARRRFRELIELSGLEGFL